MKYLLAYLVADQRFETTTKRRFGDTDYLQLYKIIIEADNLTGDKKEVHYVPFKQNIAIIGEKWKDEYYGKKVYSSFVELKEELENLGIMY